MSWWKDQGVIKQVLMAVGALLAGGAIAGALILSRSAPPRQERPVVRPIVEVTTTKRQDVPVTITGYGTVQAVVRTQLVLQVGGRVVAVHEHLSSGGFIPAGEPLLMIDRSDYQLVVEEAGSQLEQGESGLAAVEARIEEARTNLRDATRDLERTQQLQERGVLSRRDADKAEAAWELAQATLQRMEAERQTARSRLKAAEVAVRRAELNLDRTRLTLPFDAVVLDERVGLGQYVAAGQNLGEVYGPSSLEVPVPLENEQLQWIPAAPVAGLRNTDGSGLSPRLPRAEVSARLAGQLCRWTGEVVRVEGEIDPRSRMANVVVRINEPRHGLSPEQPALLPGTFVTVKIHGSTLPGVIPVPAYAVHSQNEIWVVEEGRLRIRQVEIARREQEWVYVRDGLREGQELVITPMDIVSDGMEVQVGGR